jgi:hypothetical protein
MVSARFSMCGKPLPIRRHWIDAGCPLLPALSMPRSAPPAGSTQTATTQEPLRNDDPDMLVPNQIGIWFIALIGLRVS